LFSAVIEETGEWLGVLMGDLVGADVSSLGEAFLADVAGERLLTSMASLMGLIQTSGLDRLAPF
jgi:hypothetical protein